MNENRKSRLPTGLIWLLIYQWILVLVGLYFILTFGVLSIDSGEYGFVLYIVVLAGWGTAMSSASVGITRRSPRAFLLGMICHLLLEILGLVGLIGFCSVGVLSLLGGSNEARAWAPMFLLFALMWLPFVLISGWGFFYLRRLRKSIFSQ